MISVENKAGHWTLNKIILLNSISGPLPKGKLFSGCDIRRVLGGSYSDGRYIYQKLQLKNATCDTRTLS